MRPSAALSLRARIALPALLVALMLASVWLYGDRAERSTVELRGAALGTTWSVKLVVPGGLVRLGQEHHVFDDKPPVIRVRDASVSDHTLMSVDASIEALAEHYVVD